MRTLSRERGIQPADGLTCIQSVSPCNCIQLSTVCVAVLQRRHNERTRSIRFKNYRDRPSRHPTHSNNGRTTLNISAKKVTIRPSTPEAASDVGGGVRQSRGGNCRWSSETDRRPTRRLSRFHAATDTGTRAGPLPGGLWSAQSGVRR